MYIIFNNNYNLFIIRYQLLFVELLFLLYII